LFAQTLQGIIKAFGGEFNLEALLACIGEEDKAALALDQAFIQFEAAIKDKKPDEAIGGVILTVAGIMQAKQGLAACEAIDKSSWDYQGFLNSEKLMSNPTKYFKVIEKDVLINGVSVFKDINAAVGSWNSKDYEKFGENVGEIMKLSTQSNKPQPIEWMQKRVHQEPIKKLDRKDVASFLQGFLLATKVGTFNFTNLLICIYEGDQDAEILD